MKLRLSFVLPLLLGFVLVACGAPSDGGGSPTVQVSVSADSVQVTAGQASSVTVTVSPQGGFSGTLTAELSVAPAANGITVSPLDPWSISGTSPLTRNFSVAVADTVSPGDYVLTLVFSLNGQKVGEAKMTVKVVAAGTDPDPEPDPDPAGAPLIAMGDYFVLALPPGGSVWAWGDNNYGQLGVEEHGDEVFMASLVPGLPADVTAVSVAASDTASYVLMDDGTIWAWGDSYWGQLGRYNVGFGTHVAGPVEINAPEPEIPVNDFTGMAAGGDSVLAWRADGSVWAWGYNSYGQLGNNSLSTATDTPKPALESLQDRGVEAIGLGFSHGVGLTADGLVWAWGRGDQGQLGEGIVRENGYGTGEPVQVSFGSESLAVAVAAGASHSLALLADGSLWSWGDDNYGGLGHAGDGWTPTAVDLPAGAEVTAIAAGENFSLALLESGDVLAWGRNRNRQLGNGLSADSATPVEVELEGKAVAIYARNRNAIAVLDDDSVWTWGNNFSGQRGDTDYEGQPTPPVPGMFAAPWAGVDE